MDEDCQYASIDEVKRQAKLPAARPPSSGSRAAEDSEEQAAKKLDGGEPEPSNPPAPPPLPPPNKPQGMLAAVKHIAGEYCTACRRC